MGYQHGLFSWADVSSPDPAAASKFYAGLFGWDTADQTMPDGTYMYTMFSKDGKSTAGLGQQSDEMTTQGIPPTWNSYITVDDVDATVKRWTAAGGTVMIPALNVMTAGRMAFVADPEGSVVALWQGADHPGAGVFNEPNTLTWNELNTRDSAAAREFYGKALGWSFEEFPGSDPTYWLITIPEKVQGAPVSEDNYNGGILTMDENWPANIPPYWSVYFNVADAEACAEQAVALGGNIVVPVMDTPAGRIGVISDPHGGIFSVIAPPEPS